MGTVTIVILVIWNSLLVVAFALVLVFRKRLFGWLTSPGGSGTGEGDAEWLAFLADHLELRPDQADAASKASPSRT
jgi:hypothetical protein